MSDADRLHARLAPQDPDTGCIEWTGTLTENGYGQLRLHGKNVLAHRLSYAVRHGSVPANMCVCHSCDNRPCCNADHLFLGTKADNSADMKAKGREASGEKQGSSKLTAVDVAELRRLLAAGKSQSAVAKLFGVSKSLVGFIKLGKRWSPKCSASLINSEPN